MRNNLSLTYASCLKQVYMKLNAGVRRSQVANRLLIMLLRQGCINCPDPDVYCVVHLFPMLAHINFVWSIFGHNRFYVPVKHDVQ